MGNHCSCPNHEWADCHRGCSGREQKIGGSQAEPPEEDGVNRCGPPERTADKRGAFLRRIRATQAGALRGGGEEGAVWTVVSQQSTDTQVGDNPEVKGGLRRSSRTSQKNKMKRFWKESILLYRQTFLWWPPPFNLGPMLQPIIWALNVASSASGQAPPWSFKLIVSLSVGSSNNRNHDCTEQTRRDSFKVISTYLQTNTTWFWALISTFDHICHFWAFKNVINL